MTFASVLLFCSGGIAACAAVVFAVETLVAFWLHEEETFVHPSATILSAEPVQREFPHDQAA